MTELRNGRFKPEKGMHFVLTEKGKQEVASYKNKEVGKPVSEYDIEARSIDITEGYLVEVPIPDWVVREGWEVVYDYKGFTLHAGNPMVFPEKELAEKYLKHYQNNPWMEHTLYLKPGIYEGRELKKCRIHENQKVYNTDWYYGTDALCAGDLVEEDIVDELINCLPPACMRSDCTQLGEAYSHEEDSEGRTKPTFATFEKIAEFTWKFCGYCFAGKNTPVVTA